MNDQFPWWVTLAGAWAPGAGIAIWQIVNFLDARKKRREERSDTNQAKLDDNALRERELVAAGVAAVVGNLRQDLDSHRVRLAAAEAEISRLGTLGRRWNALCWWLLGEARQARQACESLARTTKVEPPLWRLPLNDPPNFDDIGPHAGT